MSINLMHKSLLYINQQMQKSFGDQNLNNAFPIDGIVLGQNDRQVKANYKELLTFPFNTIGWIKYSQNNSKDNEPSSEAKGTGFLISEQLVLTSSHNFFIQDKDNGEIKQYVPLFFSTLSLGKNGLLRKISKIKAAKLNVQFVGLLNKIFMMKNMYFKEEDQSLQQIKKRKILMLEEEAIQHDFALLKLQQPIERPQYFQLCPSLKQKCELAVTGYVHHSGTSFTLFTHSNIFNSINNGGIYYDIDAKGGQSGCPVYRLEDPSRVVGIHKAYDPQKRLNFAAIITESVIEVLKLWAQQMNVSFGKLNQNPKKQRPIKQAIKLRKKGDQFRDQAQLEEALKCYQRSLNIFQQLTGKKSIQFAKTLNGIAWVHQYNQKYEQSLECHMKELEIYEDIMDPESLEKAHALTDISILYSRRNMHNEANEYYKLAMIIYDKIGTELIICPYVLHSISIMYYFQGKLTQALEYYGKVLAIYQQQGKESIRWANTFFNIGGVYYRQGKNKQAIQSYQKALSIHQKIGKESIELAMTLNSIGSLNKFQGKLQQALEYYDKALIVYQKIGKPSIRWAITLGNIGSVYENQSLYEKANEFFAKCQAMKGSLNNCN